MVHTKQNSLLIESLHRQQNTAKVNQGTMNLCHLRNCTDYVTQLQESIIWARADMRIASNAAKLAQDTMMGYVKVTKNKSISIVNESAEMATVIGAKKEFLLLTANGQINLFTEWFDANTSIRNGMEIATVAWDTILSCVESIIEAIGKLMGKEEQIVVTAKPICAKAEQMIGIHQRKWVLFDTQTRIPQNLQDVDYFKVVMGYVSCYIRQYDKPDMILWKCDMDAIWKVEEITAQRIIADAEGWAQVKVDLKSTIEDVASLKEKIRASHPESQIKFALELSSLPQVPSAAIAFIKKVSPPIVETMKALTQLECHVERIAEHLPLLANALNKLPIPERQYLVHKQRKTSRNPKRKIVLTFVLQSRQGEGPRE
jgi:hypothetical protein